MASSKPTLNKEVWIKRFKSTHGDKYDYSKFEYVNSNMSEVSTYCSEFGLG